MRRDRFLVDSLGEHPLDKQSILQRIHALTDFVLGARDLLRPRLGDSGEHQRRNGRKTDGPRRLETAVSGDDDILTVVALPDRERLRDAARTDRLDEFDHARILPIKLRLRPRIPRCVLKLRNPQRFQFDFFHFRFFPFFFFHESRRGEHPLPTPGLSTLKLER